MPIAKAMTTSGSDRWFTPPDLLQEIVAFLGTEYYDPCPPRIAGEQISSGLWGDWKDRCVFVNPPYGKPLKQWVAKAMSEPVEEIILLLPARTSTQWFVPLYDHTICFIHKRLRFSGARENAPFDSVLVYRGPRAQEFAQAFRHRGAVMQRVLTALPIQQVSLFDCAA